MKWIEIEIITSSEATDALCYKLEQSGVYGVSILDPDDMESIRRHESYLGYADEELCECQGDDVTVKAYFPNLQDKKDYPEYLCASVNEYIKEISRHLDVKKGIVKYSFTDDKDWENMCGDVLEPINISERITVFPSRDTYISQKDKEAVFVGSGSAFGTGRHATTAMCVGLVDEILKKTREPRKSRILDLGCGSGIIAIAAAKLGAGKIDAIDIDEIAIITARENIKNNNVEDRIECFKGDVFCVGKRKYDIVAANIISSVIKGISGEVFHILADKGNFIAGGIKECKRDGIIAKYEASGFETAKVLNSEGWSSILFVKNR